MGPGPPFTTATGKSSRTGTLFLAAMVFALSLAFLYGHYLGERGMRLFYLYREEFPEIYTMKEEKALAAEIGIRRLLQLLNSSPGPARTGGRK